MAEVRKIFIGNVRGPDGITFTPSVDVQGRLSWTNNGGLPNPATIKIEGKDGTTFTPSVSSSGIISWSNSDGKENPPSVNIKGPPGETGAAETFTVLLSASSWENLTQTVVDTKIYVSGDYNYDYIVSAAPGDEDTWESCGIKATEVMYEGEMTFICGTVPARNLTAQIMRMGPGIEKTDIEQRVEVLEDRDYFGQVPYGKELKYSWAELQSKIEAGDFSGIHIGDYKTITLTTGEEVVCEVAGIDQYYKGANNSIGHHIDFISRDCLLNSPSGKFVFNDTNNNNGTAEKKNPWLASKLYQTLNDTTSGVITTLPADLQAVIIEKRGHLEERYSPAGVVKYDTFSSWQSLGKLWLPTEVEVFGTAHRSDIGEPFGDFVAHGTRGGGLNIQYPIFFGGYKHIIKGNGKDGKGGSRYYWWELSAVRGSSEHFCDVHSTGFAGHYDAIGTDLTVPLCFRIG